MMSTSTGPFFKFGVVNGEGDLPTSQNLIEHDQVILAGDGSNVRETYLLSKNAPNVIRAWRVEIHGSVQTLGQDVTIVAQEISFVGPDSAIDTSGVDGLGKWNAGNKPLSPDTPGTDGSPGQDGLPGGSAGKVVLFASKLSGTVTVRARGGRGGRGQDGGQGTNGGPPVKMSPEQWPNCGASGLHGQNGGRGGKAGAPGSCGRGGDVDIWVPSAQAALTIIADLTGGLAPEPAMPGKPGQGGAGSQPPLCIRQGGAGSWREPNFRRTVRDVGPGSAGVAGAPPDEQILPVSGANGLLNGQLATTIPQAPCHTLTDDVFAKNCSPQQLWAVLQQAEDFYLNANSNDAGPRLAWVSLVGRTMGEIAAVPHA